MNTFKEVAEQLNNAQNIAVFCHVRPDGDAIGSGLALTVALENMGKKVVFCCEDEVPEKFLYIPAVKKVSHVLPDSGYDLLVSVDCADTTRLGVFSGRYRSFKKATLNIDHHITNPLYAKYNYVKQCPATCEIMTELMLSAGYEITEEIANLLMLGLITDSGNFTHNDVSANTFYIASVLRGKGGDVNLINYNMYGRQTKSRALLYARVINNIRFALDDKLAFIVISAQDMAACGADKSVTEGFVDFPLTIDDVEVSVSVLEFKKRQYKVSLRSKSVKVNGIASSFGGGGHELASGCMLFGELEEVIDKLTYAVYQNL